jgi:hypothetical protein
MVNALPTPQSLVTDTWVSATWKEFLIAYVSFTNTSFRKTGEPECQPDLAYYSNRQSG